MKGITYVTLLPNMVKNRIGHELVKRLKHISYYRDK